MRTKTCMLIPLLALLSALPAVSAEKNETATLNARKAFEAKFAEWLIFVRGAPSILRSDRMDLYDSMQYKDLLNLGPRAVPFMVEKIETTDLAKADGRSRTAVSQLWQVVMRITKVTLRTKSDRNGTKFLDFPNMPDGPGLYSYWWHEGRKSIPTLFADSYGRWKKLKAASAAPLVLATRETILHNEQQVLATPEKKTPLGQLFDEVSGLGIDVLPLLIEKLDQNDYDALPFVDRLTDGVGAFSCFKAADGASGTLFWWKRNKDDWLLPPPDGILPKAAEK